MQKNSDTPIDESLTSTADLAFAESNGPWSRSMSEIPEAIPVASPKTEESGRMLSEIPETRTLSWTPAGALK